MNVPTRGLDSLSGSSYEISGYMRVASLAIAFYDYLQTLPFEWRMWRELWRTRRLTLSSTLFFLIRYTSILVLTISNIGFFDVHFTPETCHRYFLTPSIFKVVQTMVSQAILGFRAYNLSRKSTMFGFALLIIYVLACSLEWVTTMYHRTMRPVNTVVNCASATPNSLRGGWAHYAVAVVYDFITSVACVVFLLKLRTSSGSLMSRVSRMMLVDGVWYFVALAMVNFLNLGFYHSSSNEVQTAAASLGYCVTWIMSQRLLIHLHDASLERRNESIAAVTVTHHVGSARDVSRAIRSQFESKSGRFDLTVPDFDVESADPHAHNAQEEVDVHVRIERTVRMERMPRVYELEDYSRSNARSGGSQN
ncbi:hypothetical protein DFH06DRAFT_1181774 [Mycena polygramma]|nr:hypothetical protein DFH06DRAFT_1181774 [Mycena polygramma]